MFKFLHSNADKEMGISTVTIEYKNERFTGLASKHPDDEWSEFFGCEIAEVRAKIKAAKWEFRNKKKEYKNYENFVKSLHLLNYDRYIKY